MANTLFDKVWDSHVVRHVQDGPDVFFIDRHFIHEVTSPVAFLGLESRGNSVVYPARTFATADHNTPTINQHLPVADPLSANQLDALENNSITQILVTDDANKYVGVVHLHDLIKEGIF